MTLKRPVTLAAARRWPAAAARRESFCARMGGMRDKLTSDRTARDPRSKINRALAAWDCDEPELLERKHVTKGVRPVKITKKMVGAEAQRNPAPAAIKWEMYDPQSKTQRAMVGGVEVLVTPVRSAAEARSYEMPDWTRAILEVAPDKLHANTQLPHGSVREAKDPLNVAGAIQFARKDYKPKTNPRRKPREKVEPFPSKLEGYGPRKGLEGPFLMRNGRVVYYDPAEGAYYDPTTDFYLTSDEASGLHSNPRRKPTVSRKISQLTREGYPQRQAVAIALSEQRAGKVRANPAMAKLYTVHTVTGNGKPRDPIAHFRKRSDALTYARAYAKAYGAPVVLTSKAL